MKGFGFFAIHATNWPLDDPCLLPKTTTTMIGSRDCCWQTMNPLRLPRHCCCYRRLLDRRRWFRTCNDENLPWCCDGYGSAGMCIDAWLDGFANHRHCLVDDQSPATTTRTRTRHWKNHGAFSSFSCCSVFCGATTSITTETVVGVPW